MVTREQIVEAARAYLGVRWRHQGRTAQGMDCLGLIVAVARDLGLPHVDQTDYSRQPDGVRLRQELEAQMDRVETFQPGDVLMMRFDLNPQHVALVTDRGIIHSYAQARRVVEHGMDDLWRKRVISAYRFREVAP